jgi:hypothetical protein
MSTLTGFSDAAGWMRSDDGTIVAVARDRSFKEVLRGGLTIDQLVAAHPMTLFSPLVEPTAPASTVPEPEELCLDDSQMEFESDYDSDYDDMLLTRKKKMARRAAGGSRPRAHVNHNKKHGIKTHFVDIAAPTTTRAACKHCGGADCSCAALIAKYGATHCDCCGYSYASLRGITNRKPQSDDSRYVPSWGMWVLPTCPACSSEFVVLHLGLLDAEDDAWEERRVERMERY